MAKWRGNNNGRSGGGGHDAAGGMRWLLTYSDLITLLMVFFVVMYAMSKADTAKFNALKSSLAMALRTQGDAASIIFDQQGTQPVNQVITKDGSSQETEEFQEMIRKVKANLKDPRAVGFIIDERGLTIRFLDSILFDLGQASLRQASYPLLDAVGSALKSSPNYIRVEGYTDDLPINTVQFPSNWELSAARSIAVTRYLIEKHSLNPWRLSSLGYGEYHPLYVNTSEENRSKNRRVDIVVLRSERAGGEVSDNVSPGQVRPLNN